ncbi:MAG: hypothetical protein Q8P26_04180 [Candidatus Levybacteria bacterium]|nr:hypothetical protein [Candidatus Levybacteria bacterium]
MEKVKDDASWNKGRIIAALLLVSVLIIGGIFYKTKVLDINSSPSQESNILRSVKGTSSESEDGNSIKNRFNVNVQEALSKKLQSLKEEVTGLNIVEVASSSPQVQKILNDIKTLEQYPVNQAKEICRQICGL